MSIIEALGIDRLSVVERLELIQGIWDTLPQQVRSQEVPPWHWTELARRREEVEAQPGLGTPWREVLAPLEKKS